MSNASTEHSIQLHDGRRLAYAEYGDPDGQPVFFFHGIPGSRLFHIPDDITRKVHVRLISVERPGYGLSNFQPHRRILDWPDDISQLADALSLQKFAVVGHSGGGPYACVCAYKIPKRITAAAILSGVSPLDTPEARQGMWWLNRFGLAIGKFLPWPIWRILVWIYYHKGHHNPAAVMERGASSRPPADAALWENPAIRQVCYDSTAEGLRQGTRCVAWDVRLICHPWGFQLEDIGAPVYLWHGTDDRDAPISMGKYIAQKIPNCHAEFCADEGHILLFPHWEEILNSLITHH